jgi:hypothetical protein
MSRLAGATSTSLLEEWLLSVLRIRHIGLLSHERVHYILSVFYLLDSRHKCLTAIPGIAGPASRNADRGFFLSSLRQQTLCRVLGGSMTLTDIFCLQSGGSCARHSSCRHSCLSNTIRTR